MRDGWVEANLGEVAEWWSGGTPKAREPKYYENGTIPWAVIADMNKGVIDSTNSYITEEALDLIGGRLAPEGSVLISMYASVGKSAIANVPLATNQAIAWSIPKQEKIMPFFLYLVSQQLEKTISDLARGATQRNINRQMLREFTFLLPPLPEQKRIVDLISSVDSYIGALQQQLESAKRSRNAVLHELLTAGGDDWVETTLGHVCDFVNGDRGKNYPSAKFRQSHGIPFINAGHLGDGIVNFDSMDFISEEVFKKLGGGKIQPGDTLFCLRGSVGKFANVGDLDKGAIASSLVIIRPSSRITKDFLMLYLDSDLCSSELKQSLTGAVQPNLSANNLKSFKISLPDMNSQIEIGNLLGQFKVSIASLGLMIESAKNLRAGLLSDLLSGEHEIPPSYDKVIGAA
jgi:type I restriction enzyme S subunit